uniref:VWFA domain-containing protein n=1 Tax=Ciona intestinalis TaxID=7719 RepID=F6QQE0_CIOIN
GPIGPDGPKGQKGEPIKGEQGPKGELGIPGIDGLDGDKGIEGDNGEKGDIGPKGVIGDIGAKGDKGEFGDKGDTGFKGEIGEKGDLGKKGIKGTVGEKGDVGQKGNIGDKGEIGEDGPEGPKGTKGNQGDQGEKGVGEKGGKGETGPEGSKGDTGNKGNTGNKVNFGNKGMIGLCGKPGPAGKPGVEGVAGLDGLDGGPGQPGIQGPRGPRGDDGDKGEPGPQGASGFPGQRGLAGERGPIGPQGLNGGKGEKGEPSSELGLPGLPGSSGLVGARNKQCPNIQGEPGRDGADGLDGAQGVPGDRGPRGEPGPRGHPGTYDLDELRGVISEINCTTAPNRCQEYPVDITFLVDGSDSIDREDFDRVKQWILLTVDAFNPGERRNPLHVDVVQFSERSMIEVDSDVASSAQISDQVQGIIQMRSGTKTYSALEFVNREVWPLLRPGAFKILITMTDGDASEDRNVDAIEEANNKYNLMAAVGVGSKVISSELEDFSSTGNVFNVDNFSALESIISDIVENICAGIKEIEVPTAAPTSPSGIGCSNARVDLAFVLDGSASVGEDGFVLLREFLINVVSAFTNIGNDGVQVAMIQYNDNPRMEFDFEQTVDKTSVLDAIDGLVYMGGNTKTGLALTFLQSAYEDARPHSDKVAVVVTDGRSQDDVIIPSQQLKREVSTGTTIFAIGVGEAERMELVEMASVPVDKFVFSVDDYTDIASIQENLIKQIC